ncbi:MAG: NAD-dependent epimerase/dehydratase family protein [Bacteroidales bacterium]|jgi:UDP-glucose 4-epimerase|nr:NAD-dependent epimerase/dehydratase family protein [Bacteroidales bacterium]
MTAPKKHNILVTGGAGFIGSYLVERLLRDGRYFILVADDLSTGDTRKLPQASEDCLQFVHCNVNKYEEIAAIMHARSFDYVFHYAAMVGVLRTQQHPLQVLEDIEGFKHVCSLAVETHVKRIFFSSSSEIYGEPFEMPQNVRTTPLNSRVPYAIVKNVGEAFLRSYHQEFGLEYAIFRFFNTYGPRQSMDFVMSKFIIKALRGENIEVYGDGLQTRTFCYIDDNIDACVNAFEHNLLVNDVANIGGNKEITILHLAQTIIEKTKSKSKIVHVAPLKDGDMSRRCPENTFMREVLLGRPPVELEQGIERLLKIGLFDLNV